MNEARVLCAVADLDATGAKEIVLTKDDGRYPVFVVKVDSGVLGYVNSCPTRAVAAEHARDDALFRRHPELLILRQSRRAFRRRERQVHPRPVQRLKPATVSRGDRRRRSCDRGKQVTLPPRGLGRVLLAIIANVARSGRVSINDRKRS